MSLDSSGNIAVDFVWGNLPIRPNDERGEGSQRLGIGDSHKIANVSWNAFPNNLPNSGNTLDGGDSFYWPELWPCGGANFPKVEDVIDEFVSYGVPREYFQDFTFSGGETEWDTNGQPNWGSGCILYSFVPADVQVGTNGAGMPVYGSDMDGKVFGGNRYAGYMDVVDSGFAEDYMIYVLSNDPRKNNQGWWL